MTATAGGFLPVLVVPDPADAALVFEALNALYAQSTDDDDDRRGRLATLLVAARAETKKAPR